MHLTAAPTDGKTFRIMVVDEDIPLAKQLLQHLQKAGFQVGVAENGERAWQCFQKLDPHLILLDVTIANMSGWDLVTQIREKSLVPILIVTSTNSIDDQIRGLKLGADDYIPKPYHTQVLVARTIAKLRRVYRYGSELQKAAKIEVEKNSFAQPAAMPKGWSRCDECGYIGPSFKFEAEDSNGRRIFVCPHCKGRTMTFSLG